MSVAAPPSHANKTSRKSFVPKGLAELFNMESFTDAVQPAARTLAQMFSSDLANVNKVNNDKGAANLLSRSMQSKVAAKKVLYCTK